ncbi:MAG TPA: isoprenylcysteine carboxylmethyltransferase family protein [Candidatus Limnocylindria bacterium]|nr:isoprenylcysteine carboxylmethyltransferase family protein [Candidatus Limnocylindria bacterium]
MDKVSPNVGRVLIALSRWRIQLGFCFAIAALFWARPTWRSYVTFLPLVVAGVALRAWARGHLDRAERVCISGPYRLMRHPLYVGSFLMSLGVTLMALPWPFVPLHAFVFLVMYVPKAIREEAYLSSRFGGAYAVYASAVGPLMPHPGEHLVADDVRSHFEWRRVWRHREWRTWLGVAAVLVLVWLPSTLRPLVCRAAFAAESRSDIGACRIIAPSPLVRATTAADAPTRRFRAPRHREVCATGHPRIAPQGLAGSHIDPGLCRSAGRAGTPRCARDEESDVAVDRLRARPPGA